MFVEAAIEVPVWEISILFFFSGCFLLGAFSIESCYKFLYFHAQSLSGRYKYGSLPFFLFSFSAWPRDPCIAIRGPREVLMFSFPLPFFFFSFFLFPSWLQPTRFYVTFFCLSQFLPLFLLISLPAFHFFFPLVSFRFLFPPSFRHLFPRPHWACIQRTRIALNGFEEGLILMTTFFVLFVYKKTKQMWMLTFLFCTRRRHTFEERQAQTVDFIT